MLGRVDLVLDGTRVLRLEVQSAGWVLRGGVVGPDAIWRRGEEERTERAHGFTGSSPAYAIALSRLGAGRRRLVRIGDPVLATQVVDQQWTLAGADQRDGLPVDTWHVDDLATGQRNVLHLAGDVVLAADGVRLAELEGPPTLTRS